MIKRLKVIYVPGIGDAGGRFQPWAVSTWRHWGVDADLYPMHWADDVPWEDKLLKLLRHIDTLAKTRQVALVGASAGAAAVIQAYAARPDLLVGAVTICGKINHPETIGPRYRSRNPSFVTAAYQTGAALSGLDEAHRARILCRYALFDEVIRNKDDSRIAGARNRLSPTFFHALTIGFQITLGAPSFISFLKKQAASAV
jgi:pimeloyl-ACP methyl ester carboxylesterase